MEDKAGMVLYRILKSLHNISYRTLQYNQTQAEFQGVPIVKLRLNAVVNCARQISSFHFQIVCNTENPPQ